MEIFSTKAPDEESALREKALYEKIGRLEVEVYICPADNGKMFRKGAKKFINYYNNRRPHSSLDGKPPFEWYEYAA